MRYLPVVLGLGILLLFGGCGYKEGVSTGEREAFLYFSGNTEGVKVSVDGGDAFAVEPGRDHQYKIRPGKHTILVYDGDSVIVERDVYVGDGVSKEIGVHK
jgi:hypothetical protein